MSEARSDQSEFPFVSIIIINRNGLRYLEPCLRSVMNLEYSKSKYEVIMVDNASSDGSIDYVTRNFPEVRTIRLERNFGFCYPNNVGAELARGEYLALLNNDTEVDRQWLRELVRGLRVDPTVKSVASKILYCDQRDRINAAGGRLTTIGAGFYVGYGDPDGPEYSKPDFTGFGCAAGVLVERKFFLDMGGFDPEYFAGIEEMELGWRIWAQGYKVYYMPSARMFHWESGTFGKRAGYLPVKILLTTRNRLFNMTKNVQSLARGILLCLIHDSIVLLGFTLRGRIQNARNILISYVQYIRQLRRMLSIRQAVQGQRRLSDDELVKLGVLATFRQLSHEYRRFAKYVKDPHYLSWQS